MADECRGRRPLWQDEEPLLLAVGELYHEGQRPPGVRNGSRGPVRAADGEVGPQPDPMAFPGHGEAPVDPRFHVGDSRNRLKEHGELPAFPGRRVDQLGEAVLIRDPLDSGGDRQYSRRTPTGLYFQGEAHGQEEERIAVVTHGGFMNDLLHAIADVGSADGIYFSHQNTGISRIDFMEDGTVRVRYLNWVAHLPPELVT